MVLLVNQNNEDGETVMPKKTVADPTPEDVLGALVHVFEVYAENIIQSNSTVKAKKTKLQNLAGVLISHIGKVKASKAKPEESIKDYISCYNSWYLGCPNSTPCDYDKFWECIGNC